MYKSALIPEKQSLALPFVASVVGHFGVALIVGVLTLLANMARGPILDPNDVMEVSMVVLPKSEKMPERATRAPVPKGEQVPDPTPQPKPPVESDLKFETEEAPKAEGTPDRSADREALMRELKRKQLLDAAAADVGPVDRDATDPDSTSDEAINTGGSGAAADPELAKWVVKVREIFAKDFRPLPTIVSANPNIRCVMLVKIDGDGNVLARQMHEPSGNASYDGAAERAAAAVSKVPPPPEKYQDESHTLRVDFSP
ncbi:MAG: TonB family protein [Deltaproteobacteria bacterium]|nr:MAG: TonB family protein [Deltaproteobacteria bacterium]